MKCRLFKSPSQHGFTIVELMIATSVLSIILLLVTVMMISIGSLFSKGINQARVQDSVRTITDDVSQHLKLVDGTITPMTPKPFGGFTVQGYCIGNTRYSAIIGHQIGTGNERTTTGTTPRAPHVLWRDSDTGACTPLDLTQANPTGSGTDGTELITAGSRLTDFTITGTSSPFTVSVGVAYGEADLLTAPSGSGAHCVGTTGTQYCASAVLNTLVTKRLQ